MSLTAVIVDDSPVEAYELVPVLKKCGVTVLEIAHDGASGLEAIRKHNPTIATLDINLPMMNGIDIARTLRAEKLPTKIVMCSGTTVGAVKRQLDAIGVDLFVKKPYDRILAGRDIAALVQKIDNG